MKPGRDMRRDRKRRATESRLYRRYTKRTGRVNNLFLGQTLMHGSSNVSLQVGRHRYVPGCTQVPPPRYLMLNTLSNTCGTQNLNGFDATRGRTFHSAMGSICWEILKKECC